MRKEHLAEVATSQGIVLKMMPLHYCTKADGAMRDACLFFDSGFLLRSKLNTSGSYRKLKCLDYETYITVTDLILEIRFLNY
jgi:hypothetical protein